MAQSKILNNSLLLPLPLLTLRLPLCQGYIVVDFQLWHPDVSPIAETVIGQLESEPVISGVHF